ncbi:MAG: hypothetical protein QF560_12370 [SAR324 cluster bacterium]|jgi:uncharacterized coiled-coil protein SlyX|nr:hypothetical protein [Deltaproteobacteria bacterium]MAE00447.1 hypothetical protein [Pseudomonadota bacterium]MDP6092319.1 hypothetical protein [SAR324 cluster bacterium]MBI13985.1 hypothetical protein [Deltaproteobacteria bacterium]MBP46053.1 hypothetical protein [Deltaproteobacteria bacterium]|tara:strand:- start:5184 stop:5411 length:228 start_codon:yes stop_codon:yes gene_type:complete
MNDRSEKEKELEEKIKELEFRIEMDESLYNELANHHKVNRTLINNYRETLKELKLQNLGDEISSRIDELSKEKAD